MMIIIRLSDTLLNDASADRFRFFGNRGREKGHTLLNSGLASTFGDRNLICRCPPIEDYKS